MLLEHPDFKIVSDDHRHYARQMLNKGAQAAHHDLYDLGRENSFDQQIASEYLTHKLGHIRDAARSYIERQAEEVLRNHFIKLDQQI